MRSCGALSASRAHAGLFAGASLFISAAVVPSAAEEAEERDQEKTPKSNIDPVLLFQRVYPKAARMQAPLALVGGAASLYAFLNSPDVDETFVTDTTSGLPWLYSSVLMGSIVPCAWPAHAPGWACGGGQAQWWRAACGCRL